MLLAVRQSCDEAVICVCVERYGHSLKWETTSTSIMSNRIVGTSCNHISCLRLSTRADIIDIEEEDEFEDEFQLTAVRIEY